MSRHHFTTFIVVLWVMFFILAYVTSYAHYFTQWYFTGSVISLFALAIINVVLSVIYLTKDNPTRF